MKKNTVIIGIASAILIGAVVYYIRKNKQHEKQQLLHVADAGYETAHDVLFPMKSRWWKRM